MRNTIPIAFLFVAASFLVGGGSAARAQSVYTVTDQNRLGTLSLATGTFTQIGANFAPAIIPASLGFGQSKQLYLLDSANTLYTVSTSTGGLGAGVSLATPNGEVVASITGDNNGNLWGIAPTSDGTDTELLRVFASGATTKVGVLGQGRADIDGGLAFDNTGSLFLSPGQSGDAFYSVNTGTGAATRLTTSAGFATGQGTYGMVYSANQLQVADDGGNLYSVNRGTGAATSTGAKYDAQAIGVILGLATPDFGADVVPEPGTWLLISIGGLAGLCHRSRVRGQSAR